MPDCRAAPCQGVDDFVEWRRSCRGRQVVSTDGPFPERELVCEDLDAGLGGELEACRLFTPTGRDHSILDEEENDVVPLTRKVRRDFENKGDVTRFERITRLDEQVRPHGNLRFPRRPLQAAWLARPVGEVNGRGRSCHSLSIGPFRVLASSPRRPVHVIGALLVTGERRVVGLVTDDALVSRWGEAREGELMSGLETHYSARDIEARILAGVRAAGMNPDQRLSPEQLGALDHFHTGGLRASRELLEVARIRAEDRVLDVGAGLGGSARLLASTVGCRVDCVELSPDYCAGARLLNRLTGLEDRIEVHHGSALDLPFSDGSFDVVWMQNVGMNIADKRRLYAEISRVLGPGGRYVFQEMAAGELPPSRFPLPWASDPADSFLVSAEQMRAALSECGLVLELFEDTSDAHLSRTIANATPAAPGQLGLAVFVDNLPEKAANARRCLEEGQVRLVRGVFRAN